MPFETERLIAERKTQPDDESSLNCEVCEFEDVEAARTAFEAVKKRLRDVNEWNSRAGLSSYKLFDGTGAPLNSHTLKEGQFVKIALTGAGKSDWVRIKKVHETDNELVITVKPTYDPTHSPQQTGETSHFFTAEATNNFCAFCDGQKVAVYVIGLNEKLNSGHTSGIIETARNALVANLGHYLGVQKAEWNKFCDAMLDGLGGKSE